jgi:hypothetical protein
MQKAFSIFLTTLLLVAFSQCTSDQRALDRSLKQAAAEINRMTPMMLSEFTRLDSVTVLLAPERRFQYHYAVINTSNPDSLLFSELEFTREAVRFAYFTAPEMAIFRDNNVIIDYIYSDESGRVIYTITITPNDNHE